MKASRRRTRSARSPEGARIRAVLFNWGGTLVHVPGVTKEYAAHAKCVEALFGLYARGQLGADLPGDRATWDDFHTVYRIVCSEMMEQSHRSGREHRFEQRFSETLRRMDRVRVLSDGDGNALARAFAKLVLEQCRPIDGAREALAAVARRCPVAVVSNYSNADAVIESLMQFGLIERVSTVVVSAELGWAKPHSAPFRAALDRLGAAANDALFVGDEIKHDMQGAKAIGLRTAWLCPTHVGPLPDPSIDMHVSSDLSHLPARSSAIKRIVS